MISYAQNFEDVILWQALQDVKKGFYVDVGAGLPGINSVTKAFYDHDWSGINIEPEAAQFEVLKLHRQRDINLHIAAGASDGIGKFYFLPGIGFFVNDPEYYKTIRKAHGQVGHEAELAQQTLNTILANYPPPAGEIHFLKIDVEGSEGAVLEGLDFQRYRPWMVVVEAIFPMTNIRHDDRWKHHLLDNRYAFVYFDGLNCFYIAAEHAKRLKTRWA